LTCLRSFFPRIAFLLGALAAGAAPGFAQYVLGTPDSSLNNEAWSLQSPNMSGFRGAITNPSYFGPTGTVHQSVSVVDLSSITPSTLSGLDGLMVPWWLNSSSAPFQTDILNAFHGGMDLWLLEDDSSHNGIGTALGIVSSNADGTSSNGSAPFFSGPFGTAANTGTYGNFDQFDATTILALGGTIAGQNTSGQVTVAYWAPGTFAPGSGALVIFSDVDMISNWTQDPYSPSLTANGILALNTMAYFTAVPEPGTYALLGVGGVMAVLAMRRRRR
jgi:hypothetical protein